MAMTIERVVEELQLGKTILIYDGDEREGEADLVCAANHISSKKIELLRKEAGGLICVSILS